MASAKQFLEKAEKNHLTGLMPDSTACGGKNI